MKIQVKKYLQDKMNDNNNNWMKKIKKFKKKIPVKKKFNHLDQKIKILLIIMNKITKAICKINTKIKIKVKLLFK